MKKSELKKYIKEALTPDEAVKVDSKYKEIYAGMLQDNPLKLKKYDNPDKVAYGRAIKLIQKESAKIAEKKLTAAEKAKKEDIIMALKKQKGGKDKLKPADYAIATDRAKKLAETGQEIAKKNMDMYKDKNRLEELVKAALMGPINETLDDKVYDLVDRMLDAMGGSDNLLEELIRAMSTKDAMFYLSAIARDYGMFDDAEEISEKKKDHDGDGDIDSDDYMIARDKAIKKAKSKANESLAERILKELRGNINEALNKDLKSFGMDLKKFMEGKGLKVELKQGDSQPLYDPIGENSDFAALNLQDDNLHVIVNDSKIDVLEDIIKRYNLKTLQSLKQAGGWEDDPKKKAQSKGEIYLTQELRQGRKRKAFELVISRFDPSTIM